MIAAGGECVALAASGRAAFAAYYAAIREFLDSEVRLIQGERIIPSTSRAL
jgi:hypothetical protein